jgi:xylulose-5-phosphate/fructose-6-phosphate phosphoketolase
MTVTAVSDNRAATLDHQELVRRLGAPDDAEVASLDAWWRANNYLTVGQIYLQGNPLLREPLKSEHIKPRLLGHWGTSPGL